MLNLSSFLSLSLLFPEMGRLGLMWLRGGKGKACQRPLDPQSMVWSHPICCVMSPHGSLGHLADTHADPDPLPLVCLPTLQLLCVSSGLCQFSGLPSTNTSTHWGIHDLPEPLGVKVLPHSAGHLPRPPLHYYVTCWQRAFQYGLFLPEFQYR